MLPERCFSGHGLGVVRGAVLEAEAVISGFKDVAMMGKAVEQCRGLFGISKDAGPFAEAEVCCNNNAGPLRLARLGIRHPDR